MDVLTEEQRDLHKRARRLAEDLAARAALYDRDASDPMETTVSGTSSVMPGRVTRAALTLDRPARRPSVGQAIASDSADPRMRLLLVP